MIVVLRSKDAVFCGEEQETERQELRDHIANLHDLRVH